MVLTLTEKEVSASNFLFNNISGAPHSGASFFGHLYNTFFILKQNGLSEDVCLAGMFHAIYGTESFMHNIFIDRDTVRLHIGEYAENLVWLFSQKSRADIILKNSLDLSDKIRLDLSYILFANEIEQFGRIPGVKQGDGLGLLKLSILKLGGKPIAI
jgi:hypothetical protein